MSTKTKEISKMNEKEIESKLKDLKLELIKEKINLNKGGKTKIREIRKTIARLLTINSNNLKTVK